MDCADNLDKLWIVVVVVFVVGSRLIKILKKASEGKQQRQPQPQTSDFQFIDDAFGEDEYGDEALGHASAPALTATVETTVPSVTADDPWAKVRRELEDRITQIRRRAAAVEQKLTHERPNRRFVGVPKVYVPRLLDQVSDVLMSSRAGGMEHPQVVADLLGDADLILQEAWWVLDVIDALAEQRRHPELAALLGDADQLAEVCYRPVLTFAQAEGLKITSNHPAVSLSRFDLQIWTGLIPTSVAPIFLPPGFFDNTVWWPALTHEIGHDFYNSIEGFDAALRRDLGLPSQEQAVRILRSPDHGLELSELEGLFGAWIEEIFCDVFEIMMTGPASVASLIDLFSSRDEPALVATVAITREGQTSYDSHPPWHLRLLIATSVLSELGLDAEAVALREEWDALHQFEDGSIDFLIVPTLAGQVALAIEPFEQFGRKLAQKLYRGPLSALRGRGMRDVSGLDYGTHRHQETGRARAAFRAGTVPTARDPRPIIAGAVLATRDNPELEAKIVRLAREAIPALGTSERWGDRAPVGIGENPLAAPLQADDFIEAVVLNAVLTRDRSGVRRGP